MAKKFLPVLEFEPLKILDFYEYTFPFVGFSVKNNATVLLVIYYFSIYLPCSAQTSQNYTVSQYGR
jgi:hypothetical protein